MTVAFSQASCAMRCALPSSIQFRATTKPASVSDSLTTSTCRIATGRSGHASSASRIAARWPKRSTMRSSENAAMSAPEFSIKVRQASAEPTSAMAADTERGSVSRRAIAALHVCAADRDRIDQIGVEQQRRALQHDRGDVRLIVDQRVHDRGRRIAARAERVGERVAHQRRRIVEQHDHRAFGGDAVIMREIGIEIGAGERAGCFRTLGGLGRPYPLEKMTNDHVSNATLLEAKRADGTQVKPCGLTNGSP